MIGTNRRLAYVVAASLAVTAAAAACSRAGHDADASNPSTPIVQLAIDGADNRGPSVAANGSHVVVTWAATVSERTNVYAAVSDDAGRTFGTPVRVNDVDGDARVNGEQPPRVAIGREVVVAWESKVGDRSRVRLARSGDGGRTFGAATTVHEEGLSGARGWASLAVDAAGAVHVAWLDGRDAHAGTKAAVTPTDIAHGQHAQHEAMRQDIYQATLRPDGSRIEGMVASNVCFCCKTSTAVAPDGSIYAAWRHIYPTNLRDMAVARSTDGGRTFDAPVRVSEDHWQVDGCPEDGPSLAVDARGVVHIAWPTLTEGASSRKAIFYSYSTDAGRTFAPRVRIDAGPEEDVAAHPQIVLAGARPAIVWDERDSNGSRSVRLREVMAGSAAAASVLRPPVTVSQDPGASYPSVAASARGVVVAWISTTPAGSAILVRVIETAD